MQTHLMRSEKSYVMRRYVDYTEVTAHTLPALLLDVPTSSRSRMCDIYVANLTLRHYKTS